MQLETERWAVVGGADVNSPGRGIDLLIDGEDVSQIYTVIGKVSVSRQGSDQQREQGPLYGQRL